MLLYNTVQYTVHTVYCTILYNILYNVYIQYKYRDQDPAFNLFGSGFSSVNLKGQSNEIFDR